MRSRLSPQSRSGEPGVASKLRREVLLLVALVLGIDAVFVAVYFVAQVRTASDTAKILFTATWTLAVLLLAVRGLSRIRKTRLGHPLDSAPR
jgi:hypothetical protein